MNNPLPAAKKEKVKKEKNDIAMKDIRNLFRLEKKKWSNKRKGRTVRDTSKSYEQEREDNYKPVKIGYFWNKNYIEHENNDDRNKNYPLKNILIRLDHT